MPAHRFDKPGVPKWGRTMRQAGQHAGATRLPFYYGWAIVAVAFVTTAIAVNARTSFSLLLPPMLNEFGWNDSVTAGAFSFGFLVTAFLSPLLGPLMERLGARLVMELGVICLAAGLLLASLASEPWHIYATLGVLVAVGGVSLGFTGQGLLLPAWFVRRRGLAMSIAFSGVGVGSIVMMPWLQAIIGTMGWRAACWRLGLLTLVVLVPINLLMRRRPEDLGLAPDGRDVSVPGGDLPRRAPGPAADWTLRRALRTERFWWLAAGYFSATYVWYAVQVHQSKYLLEVGFSPREAAWALGFVSLAGVPGQIALGQLSDRVGRRWVWVIGNGGFLAACAALLLLHDHPSQFLLYAMVGAQGFLGYGLISVLGAIPAELFEGRRSGTIFGTVMLAASIGGAAGPWVTGALHGHTGSYALAFWGCGGLSVLSAAAVWRAIALWRDASNPTQIAEPAGNLV
ncbi:MAG TPA: MFS transporter [Acetobacteraceae bacterium]